MAGIKEMYNAFLKIINQNDEMPPPAGFWVTRDIAWNHFEKHGPRGVIRPPRGPLNKKEDEEHARASTFSRGRQICHVANYFMAMW